MAVNNLVNIQYAQTGKSSATNDMGMREMQAMVYEQRNRKHLLVKAPPASGKSRAMMFVALDKLEHQGIRKVIVQRHRPEEIRFLCRLACRPLL